LRTPAEIKPTLAAVAEDKGGQTRFASHGGFKCRSLRPTTSGRMKLSRVIGWFGIGGGVVVAGAVVAAIALARGGSGPVAVAQPPAVNQAGADLQQQLVDLLTTTLGPGRAVVSADVVLNGNRSQSARLAYSRRGTALTASTVKATGYRARSTTWGRSQRLTTTTYAPGAVRSIHVAVLVSNTVPAATVRQLRRVLTTAAGLQRARGDGLSITPVAFPKPASLSTRLRACLHGASAC
jgi:hypothetical protein